MVPICVLGTLRYAEMVREGRNAAAKYILNVRGARFPERVKVGLRDIGEPSDDVVGWRVNEKKLDLALYLTWKLVQAHAMLLRPSCSKRIRHDRPATKRTFVLKYSFHGFRTVLRCAFRMFPTSNNQQDYPFPHFLVPHQDILLSFGCIRMVNDTEGERCLTCRSWW